MDAEPNRCCKPCGGGRRLCLQFQNFSWRGDWYRAQGQRVPIDGLGAPRHHDATLFGSASDQNMPDHITLW